MKESGIYGNERENGAMESGATRGNGSTPGVEDAQQWGSFMPTAPTNVTEPCMPTEAARTMETLGPEAGEGGRPFGEEWESKAWKEGEEILGRYVVERELGHGGMGVVYGCFDKVGGVRVAVKVLPPELSHNRVEMEDVRENFQLVVGLRHPNIAGVRTLERDARGEYYLVMDVAEGESLREWAKRKWKNGGLSLGEVVPILRQVASALDYAHSVRVVHRDVKPGNVMIDGEGRAKVLDFGLAAQIRASLSRASRVYRRTSGTALYMAPEQWLGQSQDGRADQYALGVMAYELLSGRLPFANSNLAVLKEAVLNEEAEPIKGLSEDAMRALRRALAKRKGKRFGNCGEFVEALASGRRAGGGKKRWIGAFAALLAAAALGAGVWWLAERCRENAWREGSEKNGDLEPRAGMVVEEGGEREKPLVEQAEGEPGEVRQSSALPNTAMEQRDMEDDGAVSPVEAEMTREHAETEAPSLPVIAVEERGDSIAAEMQASPVETEADARPCIRVAATLDGRFVDAKVTCGGQSWGTTPLERILEERTDCELSLEYTERGKWYVGQAAVMAGETNVLVALREPRSGDVHTLVLPGGATMEMVWCPAGNFMMGSPANENGRSANETRHEEKLMQGFWMAKYEVTQAQWRSVMGDNPSAHKGDNLPVENVRWSDCRKFCDNADLRLPTEVEWEYACRAGSQTAYFWGNALNGDRANCNGRYPCDTQERGPYLGKTSPGGTYSSNAWGLCDMHGNVWEWCEDIEKPGQGSAAWMLDGTASAHRRVLRGGSWDSASQDCRSACHGSNLEDYRDDRTGFRPVLILP